MVRYIVVGGILFVGVLAQQVPERKLYWIHGLNESSVFWQRYYTVFPQTHKVDLERSRNVDYTSVGNITEIASNQVVSQLPPLDPTEPLSAQPIGIGHSMGGLIARTIEQNYRGSQRRFCAIITVGTPNTGAVIVDNIQNGSVKTALKSGIQTILTPFAMDVGILLASIPVVMKVTPQDLSWAFSVAVSGYAVGEIANNITEQYRGVLERYTTSPSGDMRPGSEYLATLNTQSHQVPVIAIWGNEHPRTAYRMAATFLRANQIASDPLDQAYDEYVENIANLLTNTAMSLKYSRWFLSALFALGGVFTSNYELMVSSVIMGIIGKKYEVLEWYLRVDAENTWRRLHGANWVETVRRRESEHYYNPVTRQLQRIPSVLDEELSDPEIYRMRYEPRYTYVPIAHEDPTDGLIPQPSQILLRGLYDALEAKGAGHLEQGNHPEVRRTLNTIFQLDNPAFHTPERR